MLTSHFDFDATTPEEPFFGTRLPLTESAVTGLLAVELGHLVHTGQFRCLADAAVGRHLTWVRDIIVAYYGGWGPPLAVQWTGEQVDNFDKFFAAFLRMTAGATRRS
jgi:hypothetical protein